MLENITKKDPADIKSYFYSDISGSGIPDPNIKASVLYNDTLFVLNGTVHGTSIPLASKIDLASYEIEEYVFSFNGASSSVSYSSVADISMPCHNKAVLWNGDTLVTAVKTLAPYNGVTIVKLDLNAGSVILRSLTTIDPDTYILDLALNGNDLYLTAKTGYSSEDYNKIYKIDLSTHDGDGHPTTEYTVNSPLRGGQSSYIYNGFIYFIGGQYFNSDIGVVENLTSKYIMANLLSLGDPDCFNTQIVTSPVAMPPSTGEIAVLFSGPRVHIPYNPFIYTLGLEDGSVFKTSAPETLAGNSSFLNMGIAILFDFSQGILHVFNEPSSVHLISYGTLQFYDNLVDAEEVEDNLYYLKAINKLDDKKYINRREFL